MGAETSPQQAIGAELPGNAVLPAGAPHGKLVLRDIRFGYSRRREVLHGICATMRAGELTAIVGPNGCGKTTLIKCIDRINRPRSGSVELRLPAASGAANPPASLRQIGSIGSSPTAAPARAQASQPAASHTPGGAPLTSGGSDAAASAPIDLLACPLPRLARLVGYVPQRASTELSGTVVDYLLLGRRPFLSWKLEADDLEAVADVIARLDIAKLANASFAELSGGQRQKVVVARALLQQPQVLLFDEPTSSLDIKNQREIMDLAAQLAHDEGKTVVVVLHDLNAALAYADQVILLDGGAVVATGTPADVLTSQAIERVYGTPVHVDPAGRIDPFARP